MQKSNNLNHIKVKFDRIFWVRFLVFLGLISAEDLIIEPIINQHTSVDTALGLRLANSIAMICLGMLFGRYERARLIKKQG